MNRKKIFCFLSFLFGCLLLGLVYLGYRGIHREPFFANGTKKAALFLDCGKFPEHELVFVDMTEVNMEGQLKNPVFGERSFSGQVDVPYFREQGFIKEFSARQEIVAENNKVGRVVFSQHYMNDNGKPLMGVPVELRLFFDGGIPDGILKVSWQRKEDFVYYLVSGVGTQEEARQVLEEFFALPKDGVEDVLFY